MNLSPYPNRGPDCYETQLRVAKANSCASADCKRVNFAYYSSDDGTRGNQRPIGKHLRLLLAWMSVFYGHCPMSVDKDKN